MANPGHADRERRLEALGLREVHDWNSAPAIQISGRTVPEERCFYFRARGGGASLGIYASDQARAHDDAEWNGDIDYDEEAHYAGKGAGELDLSDDLVVSLVSTLLATWRSGRRPPSMT